MDEFKDIEGEPDAEHEQFVAESDGVPWGGLVVTVFLMMLVVFAVQNTEVVTVEFLWMNGEFALSIVILVTTLVAGIISAVATAFLRKRRRKRRAEKDELKTFRSQG
jgi:uncharacterized integral membrane protein